MRWWDTTVAAILLKGVWRCNRALLVVWARAGLMIGEVRSSLWRPAGLQGLCQCLSLKFLQQDLEGFFLGIILLRLQVLNV
jgi:hypothetical protein